VSITTKGTALYAPMDYALLRSPSLPVETLLQLLRTPHGEKPIEFDIVTDPFVRSAILTTSSSLHRRLAQVAAQGKPDRRLTEKLRRFVIRMSTRPTPFGLLAGIGVTSWGRETDVTLAGANRTRTRIEMDWITDFVRSLEGISDIAQAIRWTSNSAIWRHGGRASLSAPSAASRGASIACTTPVRLILEQTRGPTLYSEIRDLVVAKISTATPSKFDRCFDEMRRLGFVYSELLPPITGCVDPLVWIRHHLPENSAGLQARTGLDALIRQVRECDEGQFVKRHAALQKVAELAIDIKSHPRPFPIQVDLGLDLHGETISSAVGQEAARAAHLLLQTSGVPSAYTAAARYYSDFLTKYGAEREIPFLEVAHPEWGLGMSPLIQNGGGVSTRIGWHRREQVLHEIVQSALRECRTAVELDTDVIRALSSSDASPDKWPTSLELNVFVLANSSGSIDSGDFKLLVGPNVGAMGAGRHFARFGDLLPKKIQAWLKEIHTLDRRHTPFSETVDLTFIPAEPRLADVTLRLPIFEREANIGVSAGVPPAGVVRLDDLVVGVEKDRLYVRSLELDQKLIVSSNSMLNPERAPRECQILLAIASNQATQLSAFQWGSVGSGVFLPRLTSGRIVLRCAQWRLRPMDKLSDRSFESWFLSWREKWNCPRWVYLSVGDNRLLLDIEDPSQVEELRRAIAKGEEVILQEPLPSPADAWLSGPAGKHVVELVVPLRRIVNEASTGRVPERVLPRRRTSEYLYEQSRLKPPGSDWLFLKLYGPRSGEDGLVTGPIRKFCNNLPPGTQWHFLRYADPRPHLRVRFHSEDEQSATAMFASVTAWAADLLRQEHCESFCIDTYEREIERYGGPTVLPAIESAFSADSCFASDLLSRHSNDDRVVLPVFIVDRLLTLLGLTQDDRLAWVREFVEVTPEDGRVYREKRHELMAALTSRPEGFLADVEEMIGRRAEAFAHVSSAIKSAETSGVLAASAASIYRSIIHMNFNRVWGLDSVHELQSLRLFRRTRQQFSIIRLQDTYKSNGTVRVE
jgi:thiopeptide-type bacteriocin biosynthesis protein